MLKEIVSEVVRWAQSLDLPLAGVRLDGDNEPLAPYRYETQLHGEILRWYFIDRVPEVVPVLLTRIVQDAIQSSEDRFHLDALTHEIRNPLAVLEGHLDLLGQELQLPDDHPRLIAMHRALERVTRRLDWATHGHGPATKSRVSLASVWRHILSDLEPEWQHRQIEWSYRGDSAWVYTDPWRVEQILFNLAKNALEASPDHAVIHAQSYQLCDDVVFRITNAGALDAEKRQNLFQSQASAKGHGHGVGLALCQKLARSIGGRIVYVPESDGVSFMLVL